MSISEAHGSRGARVQRRIENTISLMLLVMGGVFFVALLPAVPGMFMEALDGDKEAFQGLINYAGATGICWAQWEWRSVVYPRLRRDAKIYRQSGN